MKRAKIIAGADPFDVQLEIDGVEILPAGITGIVVTLGVETRDAVLTMGIEWPKLDIELDSVKISDKQADVLEQLGWTRPTNDNAGEVTNHED